MKANIIFKRIPPSKTYIVFKKMYFKMFFFNYKNIDLFRSKIIASILMNELHQNLKTNLRKQNI